MSSSPAEDRGLPTALACARHPPGVYVIVPHRGSWPSQPSPAPASRPPSPSHRTPTPLAGAQACHRPPPRIVALPTALYELQGHTLPLSPSPTEDRRPPN